MERDERLHQFDETRAAFRKKRSKSEHNGKQQEFPGDTKKWRTQQGWAICRCSLWIMKLLKSIICQWFWKMSKPLIDSAFISDVNPALTFSILLIANEPVQIWIIQSECLK